MDLSVIKTARVNETFYTQAVAAKLAGVSLSAYKKVEGNSCKVQLMTLHKVARAFGFSIAVTNMGTAYQYGPKVSSIEDFGLKICYTRCSFGLSQEELALDSNVSCNTIYGIEYGMNARLRTILKVTDSLNLGLEIIPS